MNAPAAIALLLVACAYAAFLLSRGMRREAPPDEADPPRPLPKAEIHRR